MRLTKSDKAYLISSAVNAAYGDVIRTLDTKVKKIGDQIYDLIIEVYGLQAVKEFPLWARGSIQCVDVRDLDGINGRTRVYFSSCRPWANGYIQDIKRGSDLDLFENTKFQELIGIFLATGQNLEEANEVKAKLEGSLHSALESINTDTQLKERLPRLYEVYLKTEVGIERGTNLPAIRYQDLNQQLSMLLTPTT